MQTLLSEHWHAVRFLRPRLREGVLTLHRRLRGKPWVLLVDPVTQRFHRLTPRVHRVVKLLDGRRTLDETWTAACEQVDGDGGAISQHELVQLLSALYAQDLLQSQVAPDAEEAFERHRRQQRARLRQTWINPLSIKLPLLHPDAWFSRRAALARRLFTGLTLAAWAALVLPASVLAWQHWHALTENLSDRVLAASNVVLLWFTYPIVKSVHEWAHGMAVKAFGGTVREIGLMFIMFTPVPYVDATSSYRFASKWQRAVVAAAGIMAELALGAIAVYVWLTAESGLVTAVAFNVILIAGVSTVIVNGNPLMRYDGYFILCDVLEMPNLAQRANQYWTYLVDRFAFGSRDAEPPVESRGERAILLVYGAVAPVYRLAVTIGLIWFVAGEYLFIGVVLALASAWTALVLPLWKGWRHLDRSASLARRRASAQRRTAAALVVAIAVVAFVPMPFHSVHQAVVWLPDEAIVRAEAPAHVARAVARPGQWLACGDSIIALDSPTLIAEHEIARSAVEQTEAQLRKAETDDRVRAQSMRDELVSRHARLAYAGRRVEALDVAAAVDGRWAPAAPTELAGRYVKRGEVLGFIVGGPATLVRAAVPQEDMDLIRSRLRDVQVRLANDPRTTLDAHLRREVAGGEFDLVSPALGTSGGGEIAVDPSQQGGKRSLKRVFDIELQLDRPGASSVFGDRAYVRFDLGPAPLAWQWFLRLRQLFLARLNV